MAPKRRVPASVEKANETAKKLRLRAERLEQAGLVDAMVEAFKARPDVVPSVYAHMRALGVVGPAAAPVIEAAVGDNPAPPDPLAREETGSVAWNSSTDSLGGQPVPRCSTTIESFSIDRLLSLVMCCGRNFNEFSLKGLKPPGKRLTPKSAVLELLEFLCGLEASTYVGTEGKFKEMATLKNAVRDLHMKRGRRGQGVALPCAWPVDGVYSWRVDDDGALYITHRFLGPNFSDLERAVPKEKFLALRHVAQLHMQGNFSDKKAALVEKGGRFRLHCVILFPEVHNLSCLEDQEGDDVAEKKAEGGVEQQQTQDKVVSTGLGENSDAAQPSLRSGVSAETVVPDPDNGEDNEVTKEAEQEEGQGEEVMPEAPEHTLVPPVPFSVQ